MESECTFTIIIGAMKSGTSQLFNLLSQHPEIYPSRIKEPQFFSNDDVWTKGLDWYLSLYDVSLDQNKVTLEASTNYTKLPFYPHTVSRMIKSGLNFKFIYILRNPIERIESHYAHGRTRNWGTTKKSLSKYVDPQLVSVSNYGKQLSEYELHFERRNILLLDFHELITKPESTFEKARVFLDLQPHKLNGNMFNKQVNASADKVQYPRFVQKLKPYKKYLGENSLRTVRNLFSLRNQGVARLSDEQKADISKELERSRRKIESEYKFDASHWL